MNEPPWLVRAVEWFSNETEELVGEQPLPPVSLSELQELWDTSGDAPMFGMYPIEDTQAQYFRDLAGMDFNFSQYSYFLTAYTTDWQATKKAGGYMGLYPVPKEIPAFPDLKKITSKTEI